MTLIEVLAERGLAYRTVSGGREALLDCPFCHRPKLYARLETGRWICHRCGEKGLLRSLLERVAGLDPFEASRAMREIEDDRPRFRRPVPPPEPAPVTLPPDFMLLTTPLQPPPLEVPYWRYLLTRTTPDLVFTYGMGYCPSSPRYRNRVIIPVRHGAALRTFVARTVHRECACCPTKVLYPPDAPVSHALFNLDSLRGREEAVLVEGVFDALALPDRAAAVLGSAVSPEQRLLLRQAGVRRVTLLFDGDEAGRRGMVRAAQSLASDLFQVRLALLPEGRDPASVTPGELHEALGSAAPFTGTLSEKLLLDKGLRPTV